MQRKNKAICWLRRDLRLEDHRSLFEACEAFEHVIPVFVFDTNILKRLEGSSDQRVTFIVETLNDLNRKLEKYNSQIVVLHGDPVAEVPKFAKAVGAKAVYTNEDYEPAAKTRDASVQKKLQSLDIDFCSFKDQVIFSGAEVLKSDKTPYRVFTPYKREWLSRLKPQHHQEYPPNLKRMAKSSVAGIQISYRAIGFEKVDSLWQPGSSGAVKRIKKFESEIAKYQQQRDFPALDSGTSVLSPYLRFGLISIRAMVRLAISGNSQGHQTWLSELIWREFYHMLLDQFPQLPAGCFLSKYDKLKWPGASKNFDLWCQGKTGFPIVDAAMRQLNQTGWMHNRLRMIVASFLVKDLLIDWREGEKYFAAKLMDFDLASNNGGWQWCASTGCDAQPYFRIFNPTSQSQKFDASGEFIRKWIPELSNLSDKAIHEPSAVDPKKLPDGFKLGPDYPKPIVSHSVQRNMALRLYQEVK